MEKLVEIGSLTAKQGFKNEKDVAQKFNSWKKDAEAQDWLNEMGYELKDISNINAEVLHGHKTDVQVRIIIQLKNSETVENISVKLVSNPHGFNQVDKREVDNYKELWDIPEEIVQLLKLFTGKIRSAQRGLRDPRRMFFDEMSHEEQIRILDFFHANKKLIISDVLKGRGAYAASWMLVVLKTKSDTKWCLKTMREAIEIFSKGKVEFSKKGSLNIGKITMQRKGGDKGREPSKMLQFKINPLALLGD
ncbi:MAG: type II restriction endonuclease [Candidatus Nanoarchaeia archaeon]|nr:type II restriction endonuclease [Candidatus Nanoarchaeia archaeon]